MSNSSLSIEDCKNIVNFAKGFNLKIPNELQQAMDSFMPSSEYCEKKLKIAVCRWIISIRESDETIFDDQLFDTLIEAAKESIKEEL